MASDRQSRFEAVQRPMKITPPVRARLDKFKKRIEGEKVRQVTYSELIEQLLDNQDRTDALMRDIRTTP
jgi:hypothetical protein